MESLGQKIKKNHEKSTSSHSFENFLTIPLAKEKTCQIHRNLATSETEKIVSYYDSQPIRTAKQLDCCTPNLVYLLQCTRHQKQYTGSSVNFKRRWSQHKRDMVNGRGEDCGFCEHWAQSHSDSPDDISCVRILFLDQVNDPGPREEDFPHLKHLEGRWMANLGCLTSMDWVHGTNRRDDARPKQRWKD